MEENISNALLEKVTGIEEAIKALHPATLFQDYNLLISLVSTGVLIITLYYLIRYTKATQDMKEEMVHQRIMANAHDVRFRMGLHYIVDRPKGQTFGELKVNECNTNICSFVFLDTNGDAIGRSTKFSKGMEADTILKSNYFIESTDGRDKFLETLKEQDGKVDALVETSIGDKFIYTYEALQGNWHTTLDTGNRNLRDDFVLIKKRIKQQN